MASDCERARRLLDSYHDRQLGGKKYDDMSEHLRGCESCSAELEKLQRLSRALKERYDDAAAGEEVSFSRVWAGVDVAIDAREERPAESLLDRFLTALWPPRPALATVAVAAVLIVVVFAFMPSGTQTPVLAANDCVIDSIDTRDYSVMVYEIGDSQMKVIWVMDQQSDPNWIGEET